jgi:hypothetical protein
LHQIRKAKPDPRLEISVRHIDSTSVELTLLNKTADTLVLSLPPWGNLVHLAYAGPKEDLALKMIPNWMAYSKPKAPTRDSLLIVSPKGVVKRTIKTRSLFRDIPVRGDWDHVYEGHPKPGKTVTVVLGLANDLGGDSLWGGAYLRRGETVWQGQAYSNELTIKGVAQ